MPIPTPKSNEDRQSFVSRCMGDDVMVKEYPDQKVRSGICNTQWENKSLSVWIDGLQLVDKEAEPRDEIMLFPYGEFEHPIYGKLNFDNDFFNEIITNYQNNVLHVKPFMDKQHDEDKALAWFDTSPYIRPGFGLFIKPDYTELGKNVLQTRTYRYFSPSWGKYKDPQSGKEFENVLMGGAATNIPFLKTMPPIIDEKAVLDNRGMASINLTDLTASGSSISGGIKADNAKSEQTPKVVNNNQGEIMIDKLKEKFGLSADATEDSILSKIDEVIAANETLTKKISEIEEKIEGDKALNDKLNDANKKLSEMQVKLLTKDRDEVIKKALSEGKIKPADQEYWEKRFMSDPDNIKADLERMPKVVDFSEVGNSGEGEKPESDPAAQILTEAKKLLNDKSVKTFDEAVAKVTADNPQLGNAYLNRYGA